MEVILKEDIKGLGYKNELVKVKDGYGRNYLIPKKLAIQATESVKKQWAEDLKQAAHKAERIKNEAIELASKLSLVTVEIKTKVGESGKIFGAITALQVSDALKLKGFTIDRKKISFPVNIKEVGIYPVVIELHKDIKQEIKISVVPE